MLFVLIFVFVFAVFFPAYPPFQKSGMIPPFKGRKSQGRTLGIEPHKGAITGLPLCVTYVSVN
jgi:hypothetical protein